MEENTQAPQAEEIKNVVEEVIPEAVVVEEMPAPVEHVPLTVVKEEATEPAEVMIKFTINGKQIELPQKALNIPLAQALVMINVLGKEYWDEFRKILTVQEPVLSIINSVFE